MSLLGFIKDAGEKPYVAKGVTLSAISKKYYGDPNKYNAIFESNRPMLADPNKICPDRSCESPS